MVHLQPGDILVFEAGDNWLSKCIAKDFIPVSASWTPSALSRKPDSSCLCAHFDSGLLYVHFY